MDRRELEEQIESLNKYRLHLATHKGGSTWSITLGVLAFLVGVGVIIAFGNWWVWSGCAAVAFSVYWGIRQEQSNRFAEEEMKKAEAEIDKLNSMK